MPSDGKSSYCLWQGELKSDHFGCWFLSSQKSLELDQLLLKNADRKFDMESKDKKYQNKNSKIWMLAHFDPLISWKQ